MIFSNRSRSGQFWELNFSDKTRFHFPQHIGCSWGCRVSCWHLWSWWGLWGCGSLHSEGISPLMVRLKGQQVWKPHLQLRRGSNLETVAFPAHWTPRPRPASRVSDLCSHTGSPLRRAPANLGLMLHCRHLKILNRFWTRDPWNYIVSPAWSRSLLKPSVSVGQNSFQ